MKPSSLVFAVALGIGLILFAAFTLPEPPQSHGVSHPKYASMEHAGVGIDRSATVLWLGWGLGVLEIAFFVALIALGASNRRGLRGLGLPLVGAGLAYVSVWTALVLAYRSYADDAVTVFFWGFPAPTAWMLFAIWPLPALFVVFYTTGFDRWVATPQDLAELEDHLARLRLDSKAELEHRED
jgi:hypothetical protein